MPFLAIESKEYRQKIDDFIVRRFANYHANLPWHFMFPCRGASRSALTNSIFPHPIGLKLLVAYGKSLCR